MKPVRRVLGEEWGSFVKVVVSPWAILLLVTTVGLDLVVVFYADTLLASGAGISRVVAGILTSFATLAAGVLGGVLAKRWDDLMGERVLVTKGRSAVRSLKLLLRNIGSLERRVGQYLERHCGENREEDLPQEVISTYLEEVVGRCRVLQEETVNSIEDWIDIVPEADIRTQIGLISERGAEIEQLTRQIRDLMAEMEEVRGESETEAKKLRSRIREKEEELSEARRELSKARYGLTGSVLSGVTLPSSSFRLSDDVGISSIPFSSAETIQCENCGNTFERVPSLPGTFSISICPHCQSNVFGPDLVKLEE